MPAPSERHKPSPYDPCVCGHYRRCHGRAGCAAVSLPVACEQFRLALRLTPQEVERERLLDERLRG